VNPRIIFCITWQNSQVHYHFLISFTSDKIVPSLVGARGVSLLMVVRWSVTSLIALWHLSGKCE